MALRLERNRGRIGVATAFFAHSMISGSWAARIPAVKQALGLSDGELGLALFGMALGTLVGGRLGGVVASRIGAWTVVRAGIPTFGVALCVAALAGSLAMLAVTLVAYGVIAGTVDVAMNAEAAVVERQSGRPLMSGFHGLWSLGLLSGAMVGVGAAGLGIRPAIQFGVVAVAIAGLSAPFLSRLPRRESGKPDSTEAFGGWSLGIVVLGLIAFSAFFAEGAAADWSAVFLRERTGAGSAMAAAAFASFSLGMVTARLLGDRLATAVAPVRLVAASTLTAAAGLGSTLLVPSAATGIIGFGLLGIGLGPVVPTVVSAAAGADLGMVEHVVSRVFTIGYFGSASGPAIIGYTAGKTGLRAALVIPLCLVMFIAIFGQTTLSSRRTDPHIATGCPSPPSGTRCCHRAHAASTPINIGSSPWAVPTVLLRSNGSASPALGTRSW
ncbi:MAG: MFS transporter [Actinoallomurus sp.]